MKKFLSHFFLISAILCAGCIPAYAEGRGRDADHIQIVTTIFPEYDWVMNILGDNPAQAEVMLLLDNGIDLHNFQPTVPDILTISTCDLFIYVGGESDKWVETTLQNAMNKDLVAISLMDVLGSAVKEEELIEGMQAEEHDHEHGDDDGDEHEHGDDEAEYDEHVWLSLRNAAALTESISEVLQQIDPDNAEIYKDNTAAYIEKLNALDAQYQSVIADASNKTLLFGDRFPFRYMTDDYGLTYYAAFLGCSAETEASFETIAFLAQKVDELSLPVVMTIEGTNHRMAETIVQSTKARNQEILTMDSMQAVTAKDVNNGVTYLSIMEKNLSVLKDALK